MPGLRFSRMRQNPTRLKRNVSTGNTLQAITYAKMRLKDDTPLEKKNLIAAQISNYAIFGGEIRYGISMMRKMQDTNQDNNTVKLLLSSLYYAEGMDTKAMELVDAVLKTERAGSETCSSG